MKKKKKTAVISMNGLQGTGKYKTGGKTDRKEIVGNDKKWTSLIIIA